jgi:hypothetical protein
MEKIKFNKNDIIFNVRMTRVKDDVIKIESEKAIPNEIITNGFAIINEFNDSIMADYSDYKTIYVESTDNAYYLSTGDKYVEPTPENPEPTEPIIETLENIKTNKISELNTICNKMITSGVDVEIDGKTEHFSYTIEDQANIDDIAQMAKSTNMEQSYHCDNGSCKLYTVEEITKIYMTQKMNKAHNITYANQLKLYVKSLKEKAEVESIAYGQDLTGEYLNTYNTIMEHEQSVAKAFIATE